MPRPLLRIDLSKVLMPAVPQEAQRDPQTLPPGLHKQGEDWNLMGSLPCSALCGHHVLGSRNRVALCSHSAEVRAA